MMCENMMQKHVSILDVSLAQRLQQYKHADLSSMPDESATSEMNG